MHTRSNSAGISDPVQRSAETTRTYGYDNSSDCDFRYLVAVNTTQSIHICRTAVSTFLLSTAHSHGISFVPTRICCLSDVSVIEIGCIGCTCYDMYIKRDMGSAKLIYSFSRTRLTIWKLLTRLGPAYGAPVVVQRFPVIGECAALVIICPTYPANVFCAAAVDCLCSFCWQLGLVTKFATSATRGGVFCRVVLEGMTRDIL